MDQPSRPRWRNSALTADAKIVRRGGWVEP